MTETKKNNEYERNLRNAMRGSIQRVHRERKGMGLEWLPVSGTDVMVSDGTITKMEKSIKEASLKGSKAQWIKFCLVGFKVLFGLQDGSRQSKIG